MNPIEAIENFLGPELLTLIEQQDRTEWNLPAPWNGNRAEVYCYPLLLRYTRNTHGGENYLSYDLQTEKERLNKCYFQTALDNLSQEELRQFRAEVKKGIEEY